VAVLLITAKQTHHRFWVELAVVVMENLELVELIQIQPLVMLTLVAVVVVVVNLRSEEHTSELQSR
jgi:chromate transport protein ChrA